MNNIEKTTLTDNMRAAATELGIAFGKLSRASEAHFGERIPTTSELSELTEVVITSHVTENPRLSQAFCHVLLALFDGGLQRNPLGASPDEVAPPTLVAAGAYFASSNPADGKTR
jgi:hypothetical protein